MKLERDCHGNYYTQDGQYMIGRSYYFAGAGCRRMWAVSELLEDGTYSMIQQFHTLKECREYLAQLPIYKT